MRRLTTKVVFDALSTKRGHVDVIDPLAFLQQEQQQFFNSSSFDDNSSSPPRPISAISGGAFSTIVELLILEQSKGRNFTSPLWLTAEQVASTFQTKVRANEIGVSIGCGNGHLRVFNASQIEDSDLHFFLLSNPIPSTMVHAITHAHQRRKKGKKSSSSSSSGVGGCSHVIFLMGRWQFLDDRSVVEHLVKPLSKIPSNGATSEGGVPTTAVAEDTAYNPLDTKNQEGVYDSPDIQRLTNLRMLTLRGHVPRPPSLFWIDADVVRSRRMALVKGAVPRDVTDGSSAVVMYNIEQLESYSAAGARLVLQQVRKLKKSPHRSSLRRSLARDIAHHVQAEQAKEEDEGEEEVRTVGGGARSLDAFHRGTVDSSSIIDTHPISTHSLSVSCRHRQHGEDAPSQGHSNEEEEEAEECSLADECPHLSDVADRMIGVNKKSVRMDNSSINTNNVMMAAAAFDTTGTGGVESGSCGGNKVRQAVEEALEAHHQQQHVAGRTTHMQPAPQQKQEEETAVDSWYQAMLQRLAGSDRNSVKATAPCALKEEKEEALAGNDRGNQGLGKETVVPQAPLPRWCSESFHGPVAPPLAISHPALFGDSSNGAQQQRAKPSDPLVPATPPTPGALPPLPRIVASMLEIQKKSENSISRSNGEIVFEDRTNASAVSILWQLRVKEKYERYLNQYGIHGIVRWEESMGARSGGGGAQDLPQDRSVVKTSWSDKAT